MEISIKEAAEKFKLPVDCVLYYAKEELQTQKMTDDSHLNEYAFEVIKNRLLEVARRRKDFYFSIEKGIETRILNDSFAKRNSQLILQWDKVLSLRFGLNGKRQTLEAIGDIFGVGRARVGQVEDEILKYLRHPKVMRALKEQFDYELYTPKLEVGEWSALLINFLNNSKELRNE